MVVVCDLTKRYERTTGIRAATQRTPKADVTHGSRQKQVLQHSNRPARETISAAPNHHCFTVHARGRCIDRRDGNGSRTSSIGHRRRHRSCVSDPVCDSTLTHVERVSTHRPVARALGTILPTKRPTACDGRVGEGLAGQPARIRTTTIVCDAQLARRDHELHSKVNRPPVIVH